MSPGEGMGAAGRILGPSRAELRAWKGMLVHRTGGVLGWVGGGIHRVREVQCEEGEKI